MNNKLLSLIFGIGALSAAHDVAAKTQNHKDHCARRAQEFVRETEYKMIAEEGNDEGLILTELDSTRTIRGKLTPNGSIDEYTVRIWFLNSKGTGYLALHDLKMKRHVQGRSCRVEEHLSRKAYAIR